MRTLLSAISLLAAGCACEHGIGITGEDADGSWDTSPDTGWDPGFDVSNEPSWDIPIDNLGEPGWHDSTEVWVNEILKAVHGLDVWSDPRGVFVLVSGDTNDGDYPERERLMIYLNDGTGWTTILDRSPMETDPDGFEPHWLEYLTGVANGSLFLFGGGSRLAIFSDGILESHTVTTFDVSAVNNDLAYAAIETGPRLSVWDGTSWSAFAGEPVPYEISLVWSDGTAIFCAGGSGTMLSLESGEWTVHDTGTMESFTALWGTSATDLWSATRGGQILHYDGVLWEIHEWPGVTPPGDDCNHLEIEEISGAGGVVFFHTARELLRWDGARFETLAFWPSVQSCIGGSCSCHGGTRIKAIWSTTDELFILLSPDYTDSSSIDYDMRLLRWDGHEFHWF